MNQFLLLLATLLPLISAQFTTLNPSQQSVYLAAQVSIYSSILTDLGWSTVLSIVNAATESGGIAASLFASLQQSSQTYTGDPEVLISSLITQFPTQVQSYYISLLSVENEIMYSITATDTTTSAEIVTSTETVTSSTSTVTPAIETTSTSTSTSTSIGAAPTMRAGGLVSYAAFVGFIGVGAVLL